MQLPATTTHPGDGGARRGPLMIIGGAEDKLRKRTILKEFVSASGGTEAVIALVPTASSLGRRGRRRVRRVVPAAGRRRGGAGAAGVPRGRPRPHAGGVAGQGHGRLHDRRQPAQALRDRLRHAAGRRDRGRARAWRRGRRHLRRRQHPVVPHGRLRHRRRHRQAADDPGGRRPRPGPLGGDRPALRPAQPLRAAADDRRPVAPAARHRRRRGHLRRGDLRGRPRGAPGDRARAPSRSSTRPG